ncbi:MAG: 30S ribosome-binding factor RbfA [Candidatus Pacebacteria bacterium]|nr:30S ribosome-binding factor RbfA [Candidatus Paceibacterota bacterium]
MSEKRMRRVNELLKRELSLMCERRVVSELNALLTVTGVQTAADLRHAKVYVSILGPSEEQEKALNVLEQHRREFQKDLSRNVILKYTPVLSFHIDHTLEDADRVLGILDELDLPDAEDKNGTTGAQEHADDHR